MFWPCMGIAAILVMLPRPFSQNLFSLFPRRFHIKFCFDWPSGFREKDFENNGHIDVYIPGARPDNHRGVNFCFEI